MDSEQIRKSLDALAKIEPAFAETLERIGYPGPRARPRGHETLVRAIVSQQVSIKAAAAILARVEAATGGITDPANIARTGDEALRAAGLSRQKIAYIKSLAEEVLSGRLDFAALPEDDEEAIAALTRVKGIGRWTAEMVLIFCLDRSDVLPVDDLGIRVAGQRRYGLLERPGREELERIAEPWRPHRTLASRYLWRSLNATPVAAPPA